VIGQAEAKEEQEQRAAETDSAALVSNTLRLRHRVSFWCVSTGAATTRIHTRRQPVTGSWRHT